MGGGSSDFAQRGPRRLSSGPVISVAKVSEEWLTAAEAAEALGISQSALYQRVACGWLPAEREGRRLRIRREDLTRPSPRVRKRTTSAAKTSLPEGCVDSSGARDYLGGMAPMTLYRVVKRGDLRPHKVGGRFVFKERDLDGYIEQRRIVPGARRRRTG